MDAYKDQLLGEYMYKTTCISTCTRCSLVSRYTHLLRIGHMTLSLVHLTDVSIRECTCVDYMNVHTFSSSLSSTLVGFMALLSWDSTS